MNKQIFNLNFTLLILTIIHFSFSGCSEDKTASDQRKENKKNIELKDLNREQKVTFIELGSVNCIPCKMMQPVMKKIEIRYRDQVKVIFYDVWTSEGRPYGRKYGIKVIPTQIFLDKNGKEYFRHSGFFPFKEVEKILMKGGVIQ